MTLTPPTNIAPATVAVVGPLAVTGPLTDVQLRASAVPISAAALPLPVGAAKDATLTDGTQRVGGTVLVDGSAVTQPISAAALPLPAGAATEATLATLATETTLEAVEAALAGLATDATMADVLAAVSDVALTAILEREKIE